MLPIDDPFERLLASALIATIGENLAEAIDAGGIISPLPSYEITGRVHNVLSNVFPELAENLVSGGIGVVSSILVADLIDSMGLEGTLAGDFAQSAGAQYLSTIITNLPGIVNGTTEPHAPPSAAKRSTPSTKPTPPRVCARRSMPSPANVTAAPYSQPHRLELSSNYKSPRLAPWCAPPTRYW